MKDLSEQITEVSLEINDLKREILLCRDEDQKKVLNKELKRLTVIKRALVRKGMKCYF